MKEIKIWESNLKDKCSFINNIDDFINYLEENNITDFTLCSIYECSQEPKTYLDYLAKKKDLNIIYTNKEHQVTISNVGLNKDIIVNPKFYQEHKEKIIECIKNITIKKIKSKPFTLFISDILVTDEFINLLTTSPELEKTHIHISNDINNPLTKEQIQKIQEHHLELKYDDEKISTNKLINYYTITDLKELKYISIKENISENEIENFIYLNPECIITIYAINNEDELSYLSNLKKIFNILKNHNKKYNILITIENREQLKQTNILNIDNINLTIENDNYGYTKEKYLKEEEQLDKLIEPIKKANLSPYEKYLAVYNIVKQFKPYKENHQNLDSSRYLRYILNNEYMVCVGYSNLLKVLLDKVGIPCIKQSVSVDISYDNGFTAEEIETNTSGHARNIIKIDDPKYNIHGIYIADATWDNDMELDLYYNASMTFDRKKEARRLEVLTSEDLLLDFHNFEEFQQKLDYYLKKEYKHQRETYEENSINSLKQAYNKAYNEILTLLSTLDYPKYLELYNKYDQQIKDNEKNFKQLENIYSEFLTDYASYIIPLSNQKIEKETLLQAAINTKTSLNSYQKEELEKLKNNIKSTYDEYEDKVFPYEYDHNTQHNLDTKHKK